MPKSPATVLYVCVSVCLFVCVCYGWLHWLHGLRIRLPPAPGIGKRSPRAITWPSGAQARTVRARLRALCIGAGARSQGVGGQRLRVKPARGYMTFGSPGVGTSACARGFRGACVFVRLCVCGRACRCLVGAGRRFQDKPENGARARAFAP